MISTPAHPSHRTSICFLLYRTIVQYHAMPRRTTAAVAKARVAVTEAAVDRASVEGLEGLTIGGLAEEVEVRKSWRSSSLFGSKQELQRATLDAAVEQFTEQVWQPHADEQPGLLRLLALCDSWLSYHQREALPGGCSPPPSSSTPGQARSRDAVSEVMKRWLGGARARGGRRRPERGPAGRHRADLRAQRPRGRRELRVLQLWRDPDVFDRARRSMRRSTPAPLGRRAASSPSSPRRGCAPP